MALVNAYLTVEEFRDVMRDQLTAYDHEYERAIAAASRQIDDYCGRTFWTEPTPSARLFRADVPELVFTGDFVSAAGVTVETDEDDDGTFETTWAATDWQAEPFERMNGRPYEKIAALGSRSFPAWSRLGLPARRTSRRARIRVTATWGWPEVPAEVRQACVILAGDHFKSKDLTHIASTYGNDIRIARDYRPGGFGRAIGFNRLRAPTLNPEAESLLSTLRVTVIA